MHELSKGAQKVTFYSRSGSDILSKWLGGSEGNLRDLFEAREAGKPGKQPPELLGRLLYEYRAALIWWTSHD